MLISCTETVHATRFFVSCVSAGLAQTGGGESENLPEHARARHQRRDPRQDVRGFAKAQTLVPWQAVGASTHSMASASRARGAARARWGESGWGHAAERVGLVGDQEPGDGVELPREQT